MTRVIPVGLSTISVFPRPLEDGFRLSADCGYDGVEVMVTTDARTRDADRLKVLAKAYDQPILAIHAPTLLLTSFVWGNDHFVKLERSAQLAVDTGAETVVVHPPFRWQGRYAATFEESVRATEDKYDVAIAVENMFPWRTGGKDRKAYLPGIDPSLMDVRHATLDFSHCALAGRDSLELAKDLGPRLRHLHLTDGIGGKDNRTSDEHLVPGRGNEPVAEVLQMLASDGFDGQVIAEIKTRGVRTEKDRRALIQETVDFARMHLGQA